MRRNYRRRFKVRDDPSRSFVVNLMRRFELVCPMLGGDKNASGRKRIVGKVQVSKMWTQQLQDVPG